MGKATSLRTTQVGMHFSGQCPALSRLIVLKSHFIPRLLEPVPWQLG